MATFVGVAYVSVVAMASRYVGVAYVSCICLGTILFGYAVNHGFYV